MAEHWIPNPAVGGSSPSARDCVNKSSWIVTTMISSGYKKKQGKPSRQIAVCALAGCLAWLLIQVCSVFVSRQTGVLWLLTCVTMIVVSLVAAFAFISRAKVADFLISVQSEIDKVTWPSLSEVKRATVVVLVLIVAMAVVMFTFDLVWQWFFQVTGFLQIYRR